MERVAEILYQSLRGVRDSSSGGDVHILTQSEQIFTSLFARGSELHGREHRVTTNAMNGLARILQLRQRWDEAEALLVEILEIGQRKYTARHPEVLTMSHNLAYLWALRGRRSDLPKAEGLFREMVVTSREVHGAENKQTLDALRGQAECLKRLGQAGLRKRDEAVEVVAEGLRVSRKLFGSTDLGTLEFLHEMAVLLKSLKRFEEAEPVYRELITAQRAALGAQHENTLLSLYNFTFVLDALGKTNEAMAALEEELVGRREVHGLQHQYTRASARTLHAMMLRSGDTAGAEALAGSYGL
jgi:tetratricopeptide (TPR) repeat protein